MMSVKLVHLRLGVIEHLLAQEQAQVSTSDQEPLPARLILALRRGPERVREGDLCQVEVHERDVLALIASLHKLASRPGTSDIERDRFLEAVTAVAAAPAR
jgi:translation initiation factor IF-1